MKYCVVRQTFATWAFSDDIGFLQHIEDGLLDYKLNNSFPFSPICCYIFDDHQAAYNFMVGDVKKQDESDPTVTFMKIGDNFAIVINDMECTDIWRISVVSNATSEQDAR